jgi:hypothetical protein
VIAFRLLCYGLFELVYDCKNVPDVSAILQEAIHRFRPSRDSFFKSIWAFLDSNYELEWGDSILSRAVLERENVERVARAAVSEISSRASLRPAQAVGR